MLGNTFTSYFDSGRSPNSSVYDALAASEWVATDRLNAATGQNFTTWAEFFGPHEYNSDLFTTVQRENISSPTFDLSALGIDIYGATTPASLPQLYAPEDIIILTDSVCNSACAVFVEMMHHETGVRTVVAGGHPNPGPMQTASGSRGAQFYTAELIDIDISAAESINASTNDLLPDRSVDTFITSIGINLRDQIRQDQPDVPVQFLYDAADCRIFYTAETWLNYTSLWIYAVNAIYSNPALCVPQSTGYASQKGTDPPSSPPSPSTSNAFNVSALTAKYTTEFTGLELDSLVAPGGRTRAAPQKCNNHGKDCPSGSGRCQLKGPGKTDTYHGRTYKFQDGTCPTNSGRGGGGLNDLVTGLNQPGQPHGKRSPDQAAGGLEQRMRASRKFRGL